MLSRRQRLMLWAIGGGGGLVAGLTYWFAWGCRRCAADNSGIAIVAFFVVVGAMLARAWGPDHMKPHHMKPHHMKPHHMKPHHIRTPHT